jgi:hypothetical protein
MSKSANMRRPPTPQQVQDELDRVLEADKQRAAVPAVVAPGQLPAAPWSHENYLNELAPQTIAGRMIKFTKDGTFTVPDDESTIGEDVLFIANVPETLIGWIKFNGPGNPPDRHMGLLYDGYRMPSREELGDLDEASWETGLDGRPADPWTHAVYLVLQRTDTNELFTFT